MLRGLRREASILSYLSLSRIAKAYWLKLVANMLLVLIRFSLLYRQNGGALLYRRVPVCGPWVECSDDWNDVHSSLMEQRQGGKCKSTETGGLWRQTIHTMVRIYRHTLAESM